MASSFWSSCVPLQNTGITVMCHYTQLRWYFWFTGLSGICFLHIVLSHFYTMTIKEGKLHMLLHFVFPGSEKDNCAAQTQSLRSFLDLFWYIWKRTLRLILTVRKPVHQKQWRLNQLDLPGWSSTATEVLREETEKWRPRGPFLSQPFRFPLMLSMGRSQFGNQLWGRNVIDRAKLMTERWIWYSKTDSSGTRATNTHQTAVIVVGVSDPATKWVCICPHAAAFLPVEQSKHQAKAEASKRPSK